MNHSYTSSGLTARLRHLALAALLAGGVGTAQAQFYAATGVTNTAGTYTDLGTGGAAIATANTDDDNSAPQAIGFTFTYNGTAYTQFVLNTNGYLKLGTVAPSAPYFNDGALSIAGGPVTGPDTDLVLPFNGDLTAGSAGGTEYRVSTTGAAGSRVCTIQWKNVSDKARAMTPSSAAVDVQYANFSFQAKLYEANSQIEFVYGAATAGLAANVNPKIINVGVKGSAATAAQLVLGVKASGTAWSQTQFLAGPYTGNGHNIRSSVLPDEGRTYRFTPQVANDANAAAIQGYGSVAVPVANPITLRGVVGNAGTTALSNVVVTLAITGANTLTQTQTVSAIAVGGPNAVVVFSNIVLTNQGTNTVTLSVPSDGSNGNNTVSQTLITSPTTYSFITPGVPQTSSYGFTPTTGFTSAFCAKFTLNTGRDVTAVRAVIGNDPNLVPNAANGQRSTTVFGVVLNATTGAVLARSPDFILTAANLGQLTTFTLPAPVAVPAGDFLVGLAQVVPAGTAANAVFPMAYQAEVPARPGLFYSAGISTTGAPTDAVANNARYMLEAVTAAPATCPTPTNLAVTGTTSTSVSFSFTASPGSTGYQIVYGPQGFTPGGANSTTSATFTGTTYTLTGLPASTVYNFYVRAICSATDQSTYGGPVLAATACTPPVISTFPYAQNFDAVATGQTLPCGISVGDANGDGFTWQARGTVPASLSTTNVARSAPNAMVYVFNSADASVGANDWFYTPALSLTAGQRYRLSFYYRSAAASGTIVPTERLEVKYGAAATPAGQTTTLFTNNTIINAAYALASNASTPAVADIVPATTGTYYVGFHAISIGDQGFLAVDDVTIGGVLATSEALKRAVTVFPNPSTSGTFSLDVRGANARQALGVEVTNLLGQRVYTGTAKDNFRNEVDLSSLAAGIYSLRVRNGEEYTVQQISIVK